MKFMDLLFKRYADPFTLIDGYIRTSRFYDFIIVFCEQKTEDEQWEFYIHRVWSQSYEEYKESLRVSQDLQTMTKDDMETTVNNSMNILGNFNPQYEEGEM